MSDKRYDWTDWDAGETDLENDDDREGVYYLTIRDNDEELAVIVHRIVGGKFPLDGAVAQRKQRDAQYIVDALNDDLDRESEDSGFYYEAHGRYLRRGEVTADI